MDRIQKEMTTKDYFYVHHNLLYARSARSINLKTCQVLTTTRMWATFSLCFRAWILKTVLTLLQNMVVGQFWSIFIRI